MIFLQQLRKHFGLLLVNNVGGPEGGTVEENIGPSLGEQSETDVTPDEVGDHADRTVGELGSMIDAERNRGLIPEDGTEALSFGGDVPSAAVDTFNMSGEQLSEGRVSLGNKTSPEEFSTGELVLTESQIALVESYKNGEIDFDHPEIEQLFKDHGLEEVFRSAGIDGLSPEEVDESIAESTPEMLEGSRDEIQGEIQNIAGQIASLPEGSPERQALERRQGMLEGFLGTVIGAIEGRTGEMVGGRRGGGISNFNDIEVVGGDVLDNAMRHRGIHENTGNADKFLCGLARSARETPWCAGFVSYVLRESGYNIQPTLSSKAFIGEGGKGHVAFYAGNGQMLGGNQSDRVSIAPIRKEVVGWTTPEELEAGRPAQRGGTPPIGSIIVFDRGGRDRNMV